MTAKNEKAKVILLSLLKSIEQKRKELISVASSRGFLDDKTIKLSQELDVLINKLQKKKRNSYIKN
ncbi:aspartyl-phosphate phosphatase Spo0E family protein [Robertmurraya korlensis]|uniref:aspartyl-phosphate phosphatase Spo0E family protein n=1 Tax=Robertmurraya korlensis TaxID=519977 RepID=UPI00203B224C|nr:aspartyl-phosphate phosphatase Spo0E family protein [Robertmurraya korlensis]MCM3603153.1 aspartyl-phosphate phosphatase Spo0E family protein [Robertmurraya korlensis]